MKRVEPNTYVQRIYENKKKYPFDDREQEEKEKKERDERFRSIGQSG